MPKTNEICKGAKHSNTRTRESQRKREIQKLQQKISKLHEELEAERQNKNKAYYYIISSGNFNRFAEFCKKHPATLDYHGEIVAELYLKAITNENK